MTELWLPAGRQMLFHRSDAGAAGSTGVAGETVGAGCTSTAGGMTGTAGAGAAAGVTTTGAAGGT